MGQATQLKEFLIFSIMWTFMWTGPCLKDKDLGLAFTQCPCYIGRLFSNRLIYATENYVAIAMILECFINNINIHTFSDISYLDYSLD